MPIGWKVLSIAALALLIGAGASQGSGSEEEQVRRITPTEADNACIGDPVTPVCAVETLFACFARLDAELCRAVGIEDPDFGYDPAPATVEYVIQRAFEIRPEDIPRGWEGSSWYRPGFYRVYTKEVSCAARQATCLPSPAPWPGPWPESWPGPWPWPERRPWTESIYTVKPVGGKWHLESWSADHIPHRPVGVSPPVSAPEQKQITPTAADSACIGDPVTPICAVETMIACFARRDAELCHKIGIGDFSFGDDPGPMTVAYMILEASEIRPEDVASAPEKLRAADWFKPGFYKTRTVEWFCQPGQAAQPSCAWSELSYYMKPAGGKWRLASWSLDGFSPLEPLSPPVPDSQKRRITPTEADSACIGDPVTPVCAVETMLACSARLDMDLCHKVGVEGMSFGSYPALKTVEYVVLETSEIRPEDVASAPEEVRDAYWLKPGFYRVYTRQWVCEADRATCPSWPWRETSYSVKPLDGEWHVVSWSTWGEP